MATVITGAQDDWNTTVSRMISYGATVTPEEQATLVDYLNSLSSPR